MSLPSCLAALDQPAWNPQPGAAASADPDFALTSSATDLDRLDAEIAALAARHPGQDLPEVRGYRTRDAARDKALRTLCRLKAQGASGLEAKARALRSRELKADHARFGALSASLSADLDRLGALGKVAAPAPEPAAPEPPVAVASDDSALLALAPELEAAASAYLRARDHAEALAPSDPGHDAAMAHNLALHGGLEAVTDRIFAHRPTTLAGVLLIAHAAAVMAQEGWDEAPEHVDGDGRLLRLVCDGLFRCVGVDWRGRPVATRVGDPPAAGPGLDAALIPLAEAAIAERRAATAVSVATDYDSPPGTYDRALHLLELVAATDARTLAGLQAKARLLLTTIPEGDDFDGDERSEALALSIARDAVSLGVAPPAGAADAVRPDPVFAAIRAYHAAYADWIAALPEAAEISDPILARRDAAFEAILDARPTTGAGRLAQLEQIAFEIGQFGTQSTVPSDWAERAGRLVNGGRPITETTMPPAATDRAPYAVPRAPLPMAAE